MRRLVATVMAWSALTLAGQGWAGEGRGTHAPDARAVQRSGSQLLAPPAADASGLAWVATYTLRQAGTERTLVVVRADDRIEYRLEGEPVRVWRRLGDGLEYRELHPDDGRLVIHAPGDLRALGNAPEWGELHDLVGPAIRAGLRPRGAAHFQGYGGQRLQGEADDVRIHLHWLDAVALPARYGRRGHNEHFMLILRRLDRVEAARAFTATDMLREIDYSDLGDMELDSFASRHIRHGFLAD